MVKILDTTLREGEQTAGVKFTKEQKIEIAKLLDNFGVDIIETGHPIISDYDRESIRAVAELDLKAETLAHARAKKEDIDAVIECKTDWIGIFAGVNELSLKYRYRHPKSKEEVFAMIDQSIRQAKDSGLKVRYTIEDATRTELKTILEAARLAKKAGADTLSLADTVGVGTPEILTSLIRTIRQEIDIVLEVHCHNDFGLALANSLASYKAGVEIIDASINGLGERAGLTSLAELCLALKFFYQVDNSWQLKELPHVSQVVEKITRIELDKLRPILGDNAFTHTADLHKKAMMRNPRCYESIDPSILRRRKIL